MQLGGNFCEKCGTPLPNGAPQVNTKQGQASYPSRRDAQGQETGNKESSNYFSYLQSTLQNPTQLFTFNQNKMSNGVISILLLLITFTLGLYFLANSLLSPNEQSLPFFEISSRLFFSGFLVVVSGFIASLVVLKFVKVELSVKTLIAQMGAFAVPFLALTSVSVITGLSKSVGLTLVLAIGGLFVFIFVSSVVITMYHSMKTNESGQFVYHAICSFVLTVVFLYIVFRLYVGGIVGELEGLFVW